MNAFSQLRLVRVILIAGVSLRAIAWGLAAALSLVVGVALIDIAAPLPLAVRTSMLVVAGTAAVLIAAVLAWRDHGVLSLPCVALWIEERVPQLEYSLVTAVETGEDGFVRGAQPAAWTAIARRRSGRVLGAPVAVLLAAIVVVLLLPSGAVARVRSPRRGDVLDAVATRKTANHLAPIVAQLIPPAYTGESPTSIEEPSDVRAIAGSVLILRGRGQAAGIVAHLRGDSLGTDSVRAITHGDRWEMSLHVGTKPIVARLTDGAFSRVVTVEPIVDAPPVVTLLTPAHDSVLRAPKGRITLTANGSDDFGIASASFEFIVSSGEGESFTFRSGVLGAVQPHNRHVSLAASLSLDSLALKPGDIVHIRAVARDGNTVSGPGVGASETRAIRIARADEYDSVAVESAAPSEADKSVVSERMLIMLAETLDKKKATLKRDTLVKESHAIAVDQTKLRRSVGDIVFTRLGGDPSGEEHSGDDSPARAKTMQELLARADAATNKSSDPIDFEGGESPVLAVNKPLLEAYNAMWDASASLELGEPGKALPHMRRALAAIQRARQAERVYLRGAPPAVIIDVDKVRLKGKDKGASSTRRGLSPVDSAARSRADRLARFAELAGKAPGAAVDSLLLLRLDALGDNPPFAAAVSDAINAMRRGRAADATEALARARRTLLGASVARDSLTRWAVVP